MKKLLILLMFISLGKSTAQSYLNLDTGNSIILRPNIGYEYLCKKLAIGGNIRWQRNAFISISEWSNLVKSSGLESGIRLTTLELPMSPFGPHNMQPIFVLENLSLGGEPRILKEKHLKLEILDKDTGSVFSAIGFGMGDDFYQCLKAGNKFSMAYSIEENTFRDKTTLPLFIRDIKF